MTIFNLSVNNYASVSLEDRVILFGSTANGNAQDIAEFKSGEWSSIGKLKSVRYGYGAIHQYRNVMIIGGRKTQ